MSSKRALKQFKYTFQFGFKDDMTEICVIIGSADGNPLTPADYVEAIQEWTRACEAKANQLFDGTIDHQETH